MQSQETLPLLDEDDDAKLEVMIENARFAHVFLKRIIITIAG